MEVRKKVCSRIQIFPLLRQITIGYEPPFQFTSNSNQDDLGPEERKQLQRSLLFRNSLKIVN